MKILSKLTVLLALFSCSKQRDQVEKFVFDNRQIVSQEKHRYEYDAAGRIKTDYSTFFMYMAGALLDSSLNVNRYEYNEKGQITRVFDSTDSTLQTKFYNASDSLVAEYTINNFGDTSRMATINYTDGKSHRSTDRILTLKIQEDDDPANWDLRNHDTLFYVTEFVYDGEKEIKLVVYDKEGNVTDIHESIYENGLKTKKITYSFIGTQKYIRQSTVYFVPGTNDFDELTLGTEGDTLGFKKTVLQDEMKIVIKYLGDESLQDVSYYDKKGQLVGTAVVDLNEKVRTVYSYTYDTKGNVLEESHYREKL